QDCIAELPKGWAVVLIRRGDLVLGQGGMPLVGDDRLPDQPQPLMRVNKQAWVGVGKARRIGQEEGLAPCLGAFASPRAEYPDIVRVPFTRAVIPTDQEVAIRALH